MTTEIEKRIAERVELVGIYVRDGAYYTAAARLRALADELDGLGAASEAARSFTDKREG